MAARTSASHGAGGGLVGVVGWQIGDGDVRRMETQYLIRADESGEVFLQVGKSTRYHNAEKIAWPVWGFVRHELSGQLNLLWRADRLAPLFDNCERIVRGRSEFDIFPKVSQGDNFVLVDCEVFHESFKVFPGGIHP